MTSTGKWEMPKFPRCRLGSSRWWLKCIHSHSGSPNMPTCSQDCGNVSCPCSADVTATLHCLRCAAGEQGRADRHTDTGLLSLFLPPLCSHLRTLQTGAAALRTLLPCAVPRSTRSSHSIWSDFFFSPSLFVQPGAAAVLPQLPGAQLGATDRPMKSLSTSSKLNSTLLVVAAVPGTDGPAGLQEL